MGRRICLVFVLAAFFGVGLGIAASTLEPGVGWAQYQMVAFPDASGLDTVSLQTLTLVMTDFDGDRVPDLLVGYARQGEGVLALHRGNIDCYRPNSPEALEHRAEGTWSDVPFLSPPSMIEISTRPEFLLAGDFNGDLRSDVVFGAENNSRVVLLPGDGQGSFRSEVYLDLPGLVTNLSSGEVGQRDGHEDLLVGIDGPSGPKLLLFQSMDGAFSAEPAAMDLPDRAEKIVVGQLIGGDYSQDFAIAAHEFLVIVDGQHQPLEGDFQGSQVDEYSLNVSILDLVTGDFTGDQQEELAVLTSDGYLTYLKMTEKEVDGQRSRRIFDPSLRFETERLRLLRSRISTGSNDDLLIVDSQFREIHLIAIDHTAESDSLDPISRIVFPGIVPAAVLPAQLNLDAQDDLVLIETRSTSLNIALTQPLDGAFVVNQAGGYQDADTSDGICDTNLSEEGSQCTFTAAVQQANASSDLNTITFTETDVGIGLLSITNPVTINGEGAVTISGGLTIEGGNTTVSGVTVGYVSLVGKGGNQISDSIVGYVTIDRSSNNSIVGNTISNALYGIQITDSLNYQDVTQIKGIRIEGNTISGCRSAGIFDGSKSKNQGSQGLQLLENTLAENRVAAFLGGPGVLILNNRVGTDSVGHNRGNEKGGISLFGDACSIQQNTFKYNGSWALGIAGTKSNTVYDNKIEENLADGILLFGYTYSDEDKENRIEKNRLLNNMNAAISDLGSNGLEVLNNEIGGNRIGVDLRGTEALVRDNFIGTTRNGEKLGNRRTGISVVGSGIEITQNVVAYNGSPPDPEAATSWEKEGFGSGIELEWGAKNIEISMNQIFDNVGAVANPDSAVSQGLGIDHGADGISPNQLQGGQNYPALTTRVGGEVDIALNSTPNSKFRIELFSNEACDETGYGEGRTFLDAIEVETDESGNAHGTFPASALYMTATALATECGSPCPSSQLFNTSEFSKCATTREPIVVNSTADDPLAGVTECRTSKGECTLRAAIELANLDPGFDEINFDLSESAHIVRPQMLLPEVIHPVRIDAAETTNDTCRPTVALRGSEEVTVGLGLAGRGSVLRGLSIYGFREGINLGGNGEHKVECCYVGLDLSGETPSSEQRSTGISISSDSNQIGGNTNLERNVISGNKFGIVIHRNKNKIQGNFIGTDVEGSKDLPNHYGISAYGDIRVKELFAMDNLIGGTTQVVGQPPGNLISGNETFGISMVNAKTEIIGNIIGGNRSGQEPISNSVGIHASGWIDVLIGGHTSSERNLISGNETGVLVFGPREGSQISLFGNWIGPDTSGVWRIGDHGKTGIAVSSYGDDWADSTIKIGGPGKANKIAFNHTGIALSASSVSALPRVEISQNSLFDNVLGGIRGLSPVNSPDLHSAVLISGSSMPADSQPNASDRLKINGSVVKSFAGHIEFFSNLLCHLGGRGEGELYLGSIELEAGGNFTYEINSPNLVGPFITATATQKATNETQAATSSFSNCIPVSRFDPSEGEIALGNLKVGIRAGTGTTITEVGGSGAPSTEKPSHLFLLSPLLQLVLDLGGSGQSLLFAHQNLLQEITLTLELPEGTRVDSYYNYGSTPDNTEPHWYEFLYDGETGAEILEDQILLHFGDGERGDHDLAINGQIDTLGTPVLLGKTLYFPYNHVAEGSFVGFAVSNLSDEKAILKYRAFNEEGCQPDSIDQDEILSLDSGHQLARLGTDIFDHDFGELNQELLDLIAEVEEINPSQLKPEKDERSWVELTSSESEIGSFFQLGTWDLSQQDGSVAFDQQAKRLYFTRVYQGTTAYRGQPVSTYLSIANPNGETIELTLILRRLAGGSSPTASRSIAAKGFLHESISEIFGAGTEVAGGYVEVEVNEGDGAIGFELIEMENQDTVIGLNASFGNDASEAYSAQLASLSVLYTSVNLVNTASQSRKLTLTGINSDGTNLMSPVSLTLGPGEQYTQDAGEIFHSGVQEQSEFVGSLKVETDGKGVIGDVIFGESLQLDYAAALPLQTQAFSEAVFNQIANIPGVFFTGLAFYNPGSVAAAIELQVICADGTLVGEVTKVVEAGQRISPLVPELVPASEGQAGGYVLLESDRPIIAQLIFGALRSNGTISLFSAVPPTVLE